MRRAIVSVEDKRFWTDPGRRHARDRARGRRRRHRRLAQGASTIARAVRQERAVRAGQPHGLREAPRGGARLPPHAQVAEAEDPHRVPELDLLRQRRLRGRVGGARVLRQGPRLQLRGLVGPGGRGLWRRAPNAVRLRARAVGGGAARRDGRRPERVRPDRSTRHAAWERRDLVLKDMLQQHYITEQQYLYGRKQPLPTAATDPAAPGAGGGAVLHELAASADPRGDGAGQPGVPDSVAEYRAYYGGLKIRTTLDLEHAAGGRSGDLRRSFRPAQACPSASLVAIDNKTGEVRAMVGGPIVNGAGGLQPVPVQPGHRGAAPARLGVQAVHARDGARVRQVRPGLDHRLRARRTSSSPTAAARSTSSSTTSATRTPARSRSRTRPTSRTTPCYSQVGINVGTKKIARFASRAGIRTPVSHNYAMILGGLKVGVSPLDMAHAYETFAEGGRRVYDPMLGRPEQGPDRDRPDLLPKGLPAEERGRSAASTSGSSRRRSRRSFTRC